MKIQDSLFLIILLVVLFKKNSFFTTAVGVVFLILAIPLFATWTFFTAERFTFYAAVFFLASIILNLLKGKHS